MDEEATSVLIFKGKEFQRHGKRKSPVSSLYLRQGLLTFVFVTIVSRGDWLGKAVNIKVENNGAVGYVGSSLTVHNPLFSVHKLLLNKSM